MLIHLCIWWLIYCFINASAFETNMRETRGGGGAVCVEVIKLWLGYANDGFLMADRNMINEITELVNVHGTNPMIGTED